MLFSFIFPCFPERDDPGGAIARRINDGGVDAMDETCGEKALLSVRTLFRLASSVFTFKQLPDIDIDKVETMLIEVGLPFIFVPFVNHNSAFHSYRENSLEDILHS